MSDFFSLSCPSILTAVCSAESWRSVLKMLNSASSWPKAAPVSAALSSAVGFVEALAFADDQFVDRVEQRRRGRR